VSQYERSWVWILSALGLIIGLLSVSVTIPTFADGSLMSTHTPTPGMDMSHMGHEATPTTPMGGMDMMDHSGDSMGGHDMGPISADGVPAAAQDQGGQPLDFRLEDGVKVFELTAQACAGTSSTT